MIRPPPPAILQAVLPDLRAFIDHLVRIRYPSDVAITSWYRDADHNRAVGGHPFSQHLIGLAFDLHTSDPVGLAGAMRLAGLQAFPDARHVHVQFRPAGTTPTSLFRI